MLLLRCIACLCCLCAVAARAQSQSSSPDPFSQQLPGMPEHGAAVPIMGYKLPTPMIAAGTAHGSSGMKAKKLVPGEPRTIPPSLLFSHRLNTPAPAFPAEARELRQDGAVVIALEVGVDGTVTRTMPLSGHTLLTAPSEETIRTWKFQPFTIKGVPQVIRSAVQFDFRWRGDGTRVLQQPELPVLVEGKQ